MNVLKSIEKTIEYAQKYGSNLSEKQLFERLISDKVYKKEEISNFPALSAGKQFLIFKKKNKYLKKKIKKAKELAKLIEKQFKDILFLGITGSVAAEYPKKEDDIDLMIITKSNKLWWTRLKMRYFIYKNNISHRKYGRKENENEFCFNLWIDKEGLKLPKSRRNLRSAMDLILMKPIINKNNTYEKFIMANSWAKKLVATGYSQKISNFKFLTSKKEPKEEIFYKIVNWLVFWPQFWYMKKRIKKEKIGLHKAFFHH